MQSEPSIVTNQYDFRKQSHKRQFWTLQIGGWIGYFIIVYIAVVAPQVKQGNEVMHIAHLAMETGFGFIFSYLLWQLIVRIIYLPVRFTVLICGIAAAMFAGIFNFLKLFTHRMIVEKVDWHSWNWPEFGGWYLFSFSTMLVWTTVSFLIIYNYQLEAEHEKALKAENLAKESQLKMLRYQLNPHFMFNTMNAISTLILKGDNDKANEMLDRLSQFFRHSLYVPSDGESTLSEEIDALNLYLKIEEVRFSDRLTLIQKIEPGLENALVPSLLFQPLAENAIKHGIAGRPEGGKIETRIFKENGELVIEISDDGPGMPNKNVVQRSYEGIGLSNTLERLNTMYGHNYSINLLESELGGLTVEIKIPYKERHL